MRLLQKVKAPRQPASTKPPEPPEGIAGEELAAWLLRNVPGVVADLIDETEEPAELPDGLGDLGWPAEPAPPGVRYCEHGHQGMVWETVAGSWACVECFAGHPPPIGAVRRVAGLVVAGGELWIVTPETLNRWPDRWWGRKPGTEDTQETFR